MKRHSDEPGEGLGTPDSPEICAKIIRRYATLREEYLNGKSDSDFNNSSTTDQERWLSVKLVAYVKPPICFLQIHQTLW